MNKDWEELTEKERNRQNRNKRRNKPKKSRSDSKSYKIIKRREQELNLDEELDEY